jgi:hypothetical protein
MEKNFTLKIIALTAGLFISFYALNSWKNSCNKKEVQYVPYSDTIVVLKARIDTLKLERIKLKTIYENDIDTIYLMDTTAIDSAYAKAIQRLIEMEGAGFFTH